MTFIKLSNTLINTTRISTIRITDNKYYINLLNIDINGIFFAGFGGGFGNITSGNNIVTVCKEKNSADYTIITNWINMKTKKTKIITF